MKIKSICVFCGSNKGSNQNYTDSAKELGRLLVKNGIELVYGGGNVGLMGVIADSVLENGGKVFGVIPKSLAEKEVAHYELTDLKIVGSMHERKALMAERSDAFIALPGGFGTFEEFFEVVTWTQLGIHSKPCALFNIDHFYDPLIKLVDTAVENKFIRRDNASIVMNSDNAQDLLSQINEWTPSSSDKWLTSSES